MQMCWATQVYYYRKHDGEMISFFQEKLWEVQELLSCELSQNKNQSGYGTV